MKPTFIYRAVVDRVVDGDTVDLVVDLGFRVSFRDRFRLFGIDTPERGQAGFHEAKARVEELLPVGAECSVVSVKRGKYERWLGEIFVADLSVNQTLLSEGFAVPYA